jgi:hypothetical protein
MSFFMASWASRSHRRLPSFCASSRRNRWHCQQWSRSNASVAIPHVRLPFSFADELRETMLPIAAALPVPATQTLPEWAASWGFGKQEMRSLLREHIDQLSDTRPRPKQSVSFAPDADAVQVAFFAPDDAPEAESLYSSQIHVKPFDGPSAHKMGRGIRDGDEEMWAEISRLMKVPRSSVCWSFAW